MKRLCLVSLIATLCCARSFLAFSGNPVVITIKPLPGVLMTDSIQKAIDQCGATGGGTVLFLEGTYLSGTIHLKSNVRLQLSKGTMFTGSDQYAHYSNDAFIYGKDLTGIAIQGEGTIDGVDCYNPQGEEGFRGPHCIRLINCSNIALKDFTIVRAANWAINCRYCSDGYVENITIRGGHDGLHTRFCERFTVTRCDFRTGDDCFAGNDNRNFEISDCLVNTSCNGFRLGCLNLVVQRCRIWGPGEYMHRIRNEKRMPTAFVHFSPADENPELPSANWMIRDMVIDSVAYLYVYNHLDGLWQTGQPAYSITFENVKAHGIQNAFYIVDNEKRQFSLTLKKCSFTFLEETEYQPIHFEGVRLRSHDFFYAESFDKINLREVYFEKQDTGMVFNCKSGNELNMSKVNFVSPGNKMPLKINQINHTSMAEVTANEQTINIK